MRPIGRLRQASSATVAALYTAQEQPRVGLAGGGGGAAPQPVIWVQVTAFGAGNKTLTCRAIDDAGAMTGATFTVYAFSLPETGTPSRPGQQDLTACVPPVAVGSRLRVQWQRPPTALGTEGYWAVDAFVRGC